MKKLLSKFITVIFIIFSVFFVVGIYSTYAQNDPIVIKPDKSNDFFDLVFGPAGLVLNLPGSSIYGKATIWSILSYFLLLGWFFFIVTFFFAIAIGGIKWLSSQGEEARLQSAKKWTRNAVIGFGVTIGSFIIANIITFIIGIGSVFNLAQNLATCGGGGQAMYEFKKDNGIPESAMCECPEDNSGWIKCK